MYTLPKESPISAHHSRSLEIASPESESAQHLDQAVSSEVPLPFETKAIKMVEGFEGNCGGQLERVGGFRYTFAITEGLDLTPQKLSEELKRCPCGTEKAERIFGMPESVCGRDDRVRVETVTDEPWRWNCLLISKGQNGSFSRCTGFFIGPRTVITAGHCLFDDQGWVEEVEVIPGMDVEKRPFGSQVGRSFRSVRGWVEHQDVQYDYGAIILPDNSLGTSVGWFGFAVLSDEEINHSLVNNAGYAGDKPFGTLWFNGGRVTEVKERRIYYMIDTYGGQSGSPVWLHRNGKRHVIGIHAYGGCPNKAVRITDDIFDNFLSWRNLGY